MPVFLAPGLYLEEVACGAKPVPAVETSTCGPGGLPVRVTIDGKIVGGRTTIAGLGWSTEVIVHREGSGGATRKLPGVRKYANITLRRGLTTDLSLYEWADAAAQGASRQPIKSVLVELLDSQESVVARFTCHRCWPSKYEVAPSAGGGNEVAIEILTLENEGIGREAP
jgi:phage tail-like protein